MTYKYTRKISDYMVAMAPDKSEMKETVKGLIGQGWEPCGGIAFDASGLMFQALTKEETEAHTPGMNIHIGKPDAL